MLYKKGDKVEITDAMDGSWIGKTATVISGSFGFNNIISYRLDIGGGDWLQSCLKKCK